ncbi:MAG: hypothetical protein R3E53_21550 [Myxococcota bacterium]
MDEEGIAGEIIFPNTVPPFFRTSVLICGNPSQDDYPRWLEGIRAHNRWLVDFCAEYPERRAGIGLVYLNDIDTAIEEVKWIAKQGLRGGILLPHARRLHAHPALLRAGLRPALGGDPGLRPRHQPPWRHGLPGLRPLARLAPDPPARDALLLDPQLPAPAAVGRLRTLPEAQVHQTEAGCAWCLETLARLDAT